MLKRIIIAALLPVFAACEFLDDDIDKHTGNKPYVALDEVAEILACLPMDASHLSEVHNAVLASSGNGYDEEYTMSDLFESPGSGVGDEDTKSKAEYKNPLRDLIREYVREVCRRSLLPGYLIRTNGLMNFRSRICRSIGRNPRTGTARPFRS